MNLNKIEDFEAYGKRFVEHAVSYLNCIKDIKTYAEHLEKCTDLYDLIEVHKQMGLDLPRLNDILSEVYESLRARGVPCWFHIQTIVVPKEYGLPNQRDFVLAVPIEELNGYFTKIGGNWFFIDKKTDEFFYVSQLKNREDLKWDFDDSSNLFGWPTDKIVDEIGNFQIIEGFCIQAEYMDFYNAKLLIKNSHVKDYTIL